MNYTIEQKAIAWEFGVLPANTCWVNGHRPLLSIKDFDKNWLNEVVKEYCALRKQNKIPKYYC